MMQAENLNKTIQELQIQLAKCELEEAISADFLDTLLTNEIVADPVILERFDGFQWYDFKSGNNGPGAIRAFIGTEFDNAQKDLVVKALNAFVSRIRHQDLIPFIDSAGNLADPRNCNYPFPTAVGQNAKLCSTSTGTKESMVIWIATAISMTRLWAHHPEYRTLFINRIDVDSGNGPFLLGRAPIQGFHTSGILTISLNARYLNSSDPFKSGTDPNLWAGVIGHEILHNLGWDHPNGYPNTFIDAVTQYYTGSTRYDPTLSLRESQEFLYCDCHFQKSLSDSI